MSKKVQVNCKICDKEIERTISELRKSKSGYAFCSCSCSAIYRNTGRKHSKETRIKLSVSNNGDGILKEYRKKVRKKREFKIPKSIKELSSRTVTKIFKRMGLGCSICGWNLASCDVHHIDGKKIENPDTHSNLTYICPNCHRLVHCGLLKNNILVSLDKQIGSRWIQFYHPD